MGILILSLLALAPSVYLSSFIPILKYCHTFALASFILSLFINRVALVYRIRCLFYVSFPCCVYVVISIFIYLNFFSSGMAENEPNDAKKEVCEPDSHSAINRYIMTVFFLARRLAHFYHQPEYRQI